MNAATARTLDLVLADHAPRIAGAGTPTEQHKALRDAREALMQVLADAVSPIAPGYSRSAAWFEEWLRWTE